MEFESTRGAALGGFSDVLLQGLSSDGGLAVPAELPRIDAARLSLWRDLSYPELAAAVIGLFATDVDASALARICSAAYDASAFPTDDVVPLTPVGEITLVGLSEGPTLAFKDIAMQFLGGALDHVLSERDEILNILGATSGDTGSAAEYALRGRGRTSVFMLSPKGRMTAFQRAQMYSLADANIHNIVIDGVFDDCQLLVKSLSGDGAFKKAHSLGAVNSINFGRIAAQIVYYIWAWLRASDAASPEERRDFQISVAVPSGNFGNILSGHYARSMGLPIRRLVLATNENNVLDEFFRTGVYRPRNAAQTVETSSPSMDVSNASNLERFVFDLLERDAPRVGGLWRELATDGSFDLSDQQERFERDFGIVSGTSTHAQRVSTIARVFEETGVLIDPHTADGVCVADAFIEPGVPMLVLETAKPEKFADTIEEAIGRPPALTPAQSEMLAAPQHVVSMPNDAVELRAYIGEHARH